jgi:hypothetical protein
MELIRYLKLFDSSYPFFLAGTACNSSLFLLLYNPVQEEFLLASCYFEQTADFFRGDNREGVEARNEVSELHQACLSRNIYFFL